ncbi:RICIN domain-containing protein [Actinacidiphila rubida]|uniref:Ricin-type beta-trefoil lectin domain-like n=1 Tax=Actinacidiphila rubida TaxID=310780 RepID=A0A1H8GR76_9ACTN|nr:RICIN domain-containing protein [Actinacidiphila rubida]SEN46493.1 Ricin-type beta-trefoil lectin domain-like [Actinacidiphila rubida]
MRTSKRFAMGLGAVALGGAMASGSFSPAAADSAAGAAPRAVIAQQLTLRLASDPGQLANVRGASKADGAPIIQYPWSGTANERWEADSALGGYYRFKSVDSGKCINVQGGGSANGTPVIQYTCGSSDNELWKFVPTGIGYQVVAKSSGKCLNVAGGVGVGNALIQYDCVAGGAANDVWLPVWEPVTV